MNCDSGARAGEATRGVLRAHLALDGVEHGGVHLLAHETAGQQAPDHIELKTKKACVSTRYGRQRSESERGTDHVDDAPDGRLVGAPQGEGRLDDLHGHQRARDAADARAAQHARLRGQPDQPAGDRAEDRAHCQYQQTRPTNDESATSPDAERSFALSLID